MALAELDAMEAPTAARVLASVCSAPQWVDAMMAARPYGTEERLLEIADRALADLDDAALMTALAGHPRIGAASGPASAEAVTEQSRREQSGVDAADEQLAAALAEGNRAYEERFGHIYLVCATDRTGHELLDLLHERLDHDPVTELAIAREELGKINRIRLERLVAQ